MDSNVPKELSLKIRKLAKLSIQYQRKEPTPLSLEQIITTTRYVLKYLHKYPNEFKDLFRAWIKLIKDFVLRCDSELQLQCFSQVSVILMYALKINYRPVYMIEDLLNDWIDLLIMVPVEITGKVVKTGSSKIYTFIEALKGIGHYKYQALLMEILSRYILSVNDDDRQGVVSQLLEKTPNEEIMQLLVDFDIADMEKSIRLFLNKFNATFESSVITFEVVSIAIEGASVRPPIAYKQWIDFNKTANSLSFFGESSSESTIWNYFEVIGGTVRHISRGLNLTALLELNSKLLMNFCVDDEYHKDFDNARNVTIRFDTAGKLEDFMALAMPSLTKPSPSSPCNIVVEAGEGLRIVDDNFTNNTLNFSVLSRNSFDNGELRARFSFMGDEEPETQPDEMIEIINEKPKELFFKHPSSSNGKQKDNANSITRNSPTKKRKLFSNYQFEISSPPNSTLNTTKFNETFERSITNKTVNRPTPNASRIFKTDPMVRIPIYKTILDDWKSENDDDGRSVYSFKCNDPPQTSTTTKKSTKRGRTSSAKPKKAAQPRKSAAKAPAAKKPKLDGKPQPPNIFRRSTSRTTALEAKRVFNLQKTPPHCDDDKQQDEKDVSVIEVHSESDDAKMLQKYITGFYKNRRSTVSRLPKRLPDAPKMEVGMDHHNMDHHLSPIEYRKYQAEIRSLNQSLGDLLSGVKQMKIQILNSCSLSDIQKSSLLAELCNLLLKN